MLSFLGVIIDCNLKWNIHINTFVNKVRYLIYIFYKTGQIFNRNQLLTMFYALFCSVATYGIIAWGGIHDINLNSLHNIHNKILKIIFCKINRYPTNLLFAENDILTLRK